MIVLAVLSVIAVYIFVERFLAIRSAGKDDKLFMDRIRDYMKNNDVKSAINYCRNTNTAAARMIERGISRIGKPAAENASSFSHRSALPFTAPSARIHPHAPPQAQELRCSVRPQLRCLSPSFLLA